MKNSAYSHSYNDNAHKLCFIIGALLILGAAAVVFKYIRIKGSWQNYGSDILQSIDNQQAMKSAEDAMMVAMTIGHYPQGSPLYRQPAALQKYVDEVSKQTSRDLVVTDDTGMVIADTIPAAAGKKYSFDPKGEVMMTIKDSQTRHFMETSTDYPNGINQTVVPLTDAAGKTVGAVIFSESGVFK